MKLIRRLVIVTVLTSAFLMAAWVLRAAWGWWGTASAPAPAAPAPPRLELVRAAARAEHGALTNVARYGPPADAALVLLVAARRGRRALARLLASLERVHRVQDALLVISHSHYCDRINRLVRGVRFCRVMQLFYPYSVQLHPDRFPGPSERDCGERGADHADCSRRDALIAEPKHHWWWTANYAFAKIPAVLAGAPVMFLEERHVVAPDLLHVARLATRALSRFPRTQVVSLGGPAARGDPALLALDAWRPPYAAGLLLNSTVWARIAVHAARFCLYNDSSWGHSLRHVFAQFPGGSAGMAAAAARRVAAGGGWWRRGRARLFPARLRAARAWRRGAGPLQRWAPRDAPAGGWTDLRDHLFCLDPQIDIEGRIDVDTFPT